MRWTSITFFGVAALVVVLQLFPPIGVLLMVLGAPFWSVALINLGFLSLGAEALTGTAPRYLLLAPLLWFGGYGLVATTSHLSAGNFHRRIAAANAGKQVAWDRSKDGPIIVVPEHLREMDLQLMPVRLVDSYGLDKAYEDRGFREGGGGRSNELVHQPCAPIGSNSPKIVTMFVGDGGYSTGRPWRIAPNLCLVENRAAVLPSGIRIEAGDVTTTEGILDTQTQTLILYRFGEVPITVEAGFSRPLIWFPEPVIGCALDSNASAWRCSAGFRRERPEDEVYGPSSPLAVVARALGLKPQRLLERFPNEFLASTYPG